MSEKIDKPILNYLENLELAGITFIRGYIQFLFDGPVLNTYTLPLIRLENKTITSAEFGYSDTLYFLINKKVISAPLNSGRSKGGYSPLFRVAFELFGAILYANCMQIMKKAPTSSDVSA